MSLLKKYRFNEVGNVYIWPFRNIVTKHKLLLLFVFISFFGFIWFISKICSTSYNILCFVIYAFKCRRKRILNVQKRYKILIVCTSSCSIKMFLILIILLLYWTKHIYIYNDCHVNGPLKKLGLSNNFSDGNRI